MVQTKFASILYFRMVAHIAACHTLFFINEDIVHILLMLKLFFTLNFEAEDLPCGSPCGSFTPFAPTKITLRLKPVQGDFKP